jgi:hypothetical protein|eukprot:Transcript_18561.p3 GENE.Transcript_18561~~Transcript_18561.p3  ORF type:complete len:114 (+),score=17.92 Transcript_18561:293-634(+)
MADPVCLVDGFTYERAAIQAWLAKQPHATSPMTGAPLSSTVLVPNLAIRALCAERRAQRAEAEAEAGAPAATAPPRAESPPAEAPSDWATIAGRGGRGGRGSRVVPRAPCVVP